MTKARRSHTIYKTGPVYISKQKGDMLCKTQGDKPPDRIQDTERYIPGDPICVYKWSTIHLTTTSSPIFFGFFLSRFFE
jgi:hypothetical protein